RS
ncbi:hypothetical protein CFC21_029866, partial [Triticum aestivum]